MAPEFPTAHVDWSYSTARRYRDCPRQFYYQHARGGVGEDSINNDDSSGSVQPPGARLGTVVHDCIEEKINCWRTGSDKSLQAMQQTATRRLQRYFEQNEDTIRRLHISPEDDLTADELADSLTHVARNHLETFFQVIWPQFNTHRYIMHEETVSFEVNGHTVWVRPDFCTRSQTGDFVVTDWKTGMVDQLENPTLQSLAYALWAYQEYEPDLNRILVQLVHTGTGQFDRTRPDQEDIRSIKRQIREDRDDWTTFRRIEDYQPDPDHEKCRACVYLQRCNAGQSVTE